MDVILMTVRMALTACLKPGAQLEPPGQASMRSARVMAPGAAPPVLPHYSAHARVSLQLLRVLALCLDSSASRSAIDRCLQMLYQQLSSFCNLLQLHTPVLSNFKVCVVPCPVFRCCQTLDVLRYTFTATAHSVA